ncbi:hypothetical protein PIB30_048395 [Stylosanthes scabra]|uniref:Transposase MuDR plant domain-containing protein n=1 Tax=Stylosanthes scabra TaxID=79078 RepID=A0ABU6ZFS9_9FABA|nr:hypothetical protein [Stylosanthes scabra]
MGEEPREGFGGGGDDYDVDGGQEFRVGHPFNTREAVQLAMKNYNIKRAFEYKVVESDPYKYVCRSKQYGAGCPWSIRVSLRTNLGYYYSSSLPTAMHPHQVRGRPTLETGYIHDRINGTHLAMSIVFLSAVLHSDRYVQTRTALPHVKHTHAGKSLNKGNHRRCTRFPDFLGMRYPPMNKRI